MSQSLCTSLAMAPQKLIISNLGMRANSSNTQNALSLSEKGVLHFANRKVLPIVGKET